MMIIMYSGYDENYYDDDGSDKNGDGNDDEDNNYDKKLRCDVYFETFLYRKFELDGFFFSDWTVQQLGERFHQCGRH